MTISEIAYHNIKFLCKKKGVPLANIEKRISISVGWFSRAQKRNAIRLRDVQIASEMLDVPIANILSGNLEMAERISELQEEIRAKQNELEVLSDLEKSYMAESDPGSPGDERQRFLVGVPKVWTDVDNEQGAVDLVPEL